MATRSNIIIKREGLQDYQMYHHYDSYPEWVGAELIKMFKRTKKKFKTPSELATWINKKKASYELEGRDCQLHFDIEYLYVITIEDMTIHLTCHSCTNWDNLVLGSKHIDTYFPNGKC